MNYSKKDLNWVNVDFKIKELQEGDQEYYYFEGYGSTFGNVDRGNDVVVKGAFKESLKEGMPSLFWQHKSTEPLGVFVEAYEDEVGLFVKGKMPKADTFVSGRVIPQMKAGSIVKMSIGFTIQDSKREEREGKSITLLTKLKLWEVSLVSIPMNNEANVTAMTKSFKPFSDMIKVSEVSEYLKLFGHTNKETNSIISTIKRIARDEQASRDEQAALESLNSVVKSVNKKIKEKFNV